MNDVDHHHFPNNTLMLVTSAVDQQTLNPLGSWDGNNVTVQKVTIMNTTTGFEHTRYPKKTVVLTNTFETCI